MRGSDLSVNVPDLAGRVLSEMNFDKILLIDATKSIDIGDSFILFVASASVGKVMLLSLPLLMFVPYKKLG